MRIQKNQQGDFFVPPATVAGDSIHLRDRKSEQLGSISDQISDRNHGSYPTEGSCDDGCSKEECQTPLQLVALVVHGNKIHAAYQTISIAILCH